MKKSLKGFLLLLVGGGGRIKQVLTMHKEDIKAKMNYAIMET